MRRDHLFHAFLGLAPHIGKRHVGDIAFKHDIEVLTGHTGKLSFVFRFLDQRSFLIWRRAIINLAICAKNLSLLKGQGRNRP